MFKRKGNVAYLRTPRFYFSHEEDEYNIVIEGAKDGSRKLWTTGPRGNEGKCYLAYKWFEYYTGEKPTPSYDEMGIINQPYLKIWILHRPGKILWNLAVQKYMGKTM